MQGGLEERLSTIPSPKMSPEGGLVARMGCVCVCVCVCLSWAVPFLIAINYRAVLPDSTVCSILLLLPSSRVYLWLRLIIC